MALFVLLTPLVRSKSRRLTNLLSLTSFQDVRGRRFVNLWDLLLSYGSTRPLLQKGPKRFVCVRCFIKDLLWICQYKICLGPFLDLIVRRRLKDVWDVSECQGRILYPLYGFIFYLFSSNTSKIQQKYLFVVCLNMYLNRLSLIILHIVYISYNTTYCLY